MHTNKITVKRIAVLYHVSVLIGQLIYYAQLVSTQESPIAAHFNSCYEYQISTVNRT